MLCNYMYFIYPFDEVLIPASAGSGAEYKTIEALVITTVAKNEYVYLI